MRTILRSLMLAAALAARAAHGAAGTCTITDLDVAGTFPFDNIGGVGLGLPVEIDGGRFALQRDPFTAAYPSPGLQFRAMGPSAWLDWDPGLAEGTIDANGVAVLPAFRMRFSTDFGSIGVGVPQLIGNLNTTFSTGIQARAVSGRAYLFSGQPLQPDGTLRFVGTDFMNFQIPNQTGAAMTCQLVPPPDLGSLAAGPTLRSVKGTVKAGAAAGAPDDELVLTAVVKAGDTPLVLDGTQDVLLRLAGGSGEPLNLLVAAGALRAKGKKRIAQDTGGAVIQRISDAPTGQNPPPPPPPIASGSLVITPGKKQATFVLKLKGVPADFAGPTDVTLGVGTQSARRQVTFSATGRGARFK